MKVELPHTHLRSYQANRSILFQAQSTILCDALHRNYCPRCPVSSRNLSACGSRPRCGRWPWALTAPLIDSVLGSDNVNSIDAIADTLGVAQYN